jgi:hypothetical protein
MLLGWFSGFKLHLLGDERGSESGLLDPGRVEDRKPVSAGQEVVR